MKNMRNFTVKFLLFAVFPATVFGMQQIAQHPITAVFHPTEKQIALFYPDQSIKIWDTASNHINDVKDSSPNTVATVNAEFAIKEGKQNWLDHNSIKIFLNQRMIMGFKKDRPFTNHAFPKNILSCALNAHNQEQPTIAIGFNNTTNLYNNLNTWQLTDALHHKEGIHSTALAFNADGTILVSCTNDGNAALYVWENNKLTPLNNAIININPPIEKPVEVETPITPIITPQQSSLIQQIFLNPLSALKALYRNASFTTKTITTLASIGALWFCYTKYITLRA